MSKRGRDDNNIQDDSEFQQGSSRLRRARFRSPSTSLGSSRSEELSTPQQDNNLQANQSQSSFKDQWTQEQWDDLEKTLAPKVEEKRRQHQGFVGTVAEAGILEKIELYQFMCHKYLTFEFGSQLNFIIGHNGSGKSAILAAIAVGLGGRAAGTGRGNGIKSLIKEGQSKAEIVITLKNGGEFAYRPELYGDEIIVSRTITSSGSSNYKLKSARGKVLSTKKIDVDAVCEHFQLQVDNPISILTQDAAKTFLKESKPEFRYKLFLEGTGIQRLNDDYDQVHGLLSRTTAILDSRKDYLSVLRQKCTDCQKAFNDSLLIQDLRSRREALICEKEWFKAKLKEEKLSQAYESLAEVEARITQLEIASASAQAHFQGVETRIRTLNNQHEEAKTRSEASWETRRTRQEELVGKRSDINGLKSDVDALRQSVDSASQEVSRLTAEILQETQSVEESSQPQRDAFLAEIDALRAAVDQLNIERATLQTDFSTARAAADDAKAAEEKGKSDLQEKLKENDELRENYSRLKERIASRGDPLAVFGKNIGKVLDDIEEVDTNHAWFGRKPIGPLGRFVELDRSESTNEQYAEALRQTIGQYLRGWAVQDARDLKTLREILRRHGNTQGFPIIVSSGELFDFQSGLPPQQCTTILHVLKISDEWVKRILIDQCSIERLLLTPTRLEAENALIHIGQGDAITADGMKVKRWSDGGSRNTPMGPVLQPRHVCYGLFRRPKDDTTQLQQMIQRGQGIEGQINGLQQAHEQAQERLRNAQGELDRVQASCRAKEREISATVRERDSKAIELSFNDERPVQIEVLESLRREKDEERESFETQLAHIEAQKRDLQPEIQALQREIDDLKRKAETKEEDRSRIATLLEAESGAYAQAKANKAHYENAKKKAGTDKETCQKAVEDATAEVEESHVHASQLGERPSQLRKLNVIDSDLGRLDGTISRYTRTVVKTHEQLGQELEKAKKEKIEYTETLTALQNLVIALYHSLNERLNKCILLLAYTSVAVKNQFMRLLSTRGYFGTIHFNHIEQMLVLKVQTDDMAHDDKSQGTQSCISSPKKQNLDRKKDPASLSGGEKSLATISFLLALWDVCQTPLRCLDEFDVFMDSQNRRCAIKMLIDAAKSADGRQTIVITPQSIDNVFSEPPVVLIKQMADPRG